MINAKQQSLYVHVRYINRIIINVDIGIVALLEAISELPHTKIIKFTYTNSKSGASVCVMS